MMAKIKTATGVYDSIILGFLGNGWKTKVIVMSEDNSNLQIIKYYNPKRCVFVIDEKADISYLPHGPFLCGLQRRRLVFYQQKRCVVILRRYSFHGYALQWCALKYKVVLGVQSQQ